MLLFALVNIWCQYVLINGMQVLVYFMVKYMDIFSTTLSRGCDFNVAGFMLCFFAVFTFLLLLKHGDVEINPGPQKKETSFFSCLLWNLNSILAHNKTVLNRSIQYYSPIWYFIVCMFLSCHVRVSEWIHTL